MKHIAQFVLLLFLASLSLYPLSVNVRVFDHPEFTRVVLEGDQPFEYSVKPSENSIKVRLTKKATVRTSLESFKKSEIVDRVVHNTVKDNKISVFNIHLKSRTTIKRSFVLEQPFRVVMDLVKSPEKKASSSPIPSTKSNNNSPIINNTNPQPKAITPSNSLQEQDKPDEPTAGQTTEKKWAPITRICIDPGHGGNDEGAIGKSKLKEKDLTLKISQKLKKIIETRLGLDVVMTREKDEEISLNQRVAKANNQKAQIFVSIHVNSSFRKSARGSETYYVSLKATDQEAFLLSQKENESSAEETEKIAPSQPPSEELKMILWNMAQTEYLKESSALADYIQGELNVLLETENRGVKQAPFRVLMRAAMPAVLVETVFISNPSEEKKLQDDNFLDNVANAIYTGISKFISSYNAMYK